MKSPPVETESADWQGLLALARAGDDGALGEICERLREYLLLAAASNLRHDLTAKLGSSDIVQVTMLEACRDFDSFQGTTEAEFRAWVRRLLKCNLLDAGRQYREAQCRSVSTEIALGVENGQAELPGRETTPSSIVCRRETDEHLLRAIARLPQKYRQVIEMRHRQGLAYAEIAAATGMTEPAVRKLWSRAVKKLSQHLPRADGPRAR
jgi:RNA polymerase sigma-70 factor (ECF subfamily)